MTTTAQQYARFRTRFNAPQNIRSDEIPDILAGWRAGLIGEPVDCFASLAFQWAHACAAIEGRV
jgi:hypothetical protein